MSWFGISGETLSLITQLTAFAVCVLIGLSGYRQGLAGLLIAIGLITNVVGQIIFAGGGPGACVGFVGLPLLCLMFGFVGRGLHLLIWGPAPPPPTNCCASCGYDLTGNVSGICPECGTKIDAAK